MLFPPWVARLVWASLLTATCLVAYGTLKGSSSSGPMNADPTALLLCLLGLAASALAPWIGGDAVGRRLGQAAAAALGLSTAWWQFWLPSTLVDVAYELRYDIPHPYIHPPPMAVPVLALSLALWLAWRPAPTPGRWGLWLALTAALMSAVSVGPDWPLVARGMSALAPLGLLTLVASLRPRDALLRWVVLWLGLQLLLLGVAGAAYEWGGDLPAWLNAWGRRRIYPGG